MEDGREKILETDWDPISADGTIEKVDGDGARCDRVASLGTRSRRSENASWKSLARFSRSKRASSKSFVDTSVKYMAECRSLIEAKRDQRSCRDRLAVPQYAYCEG
jgi:hypothetical protein